MKLKSIFVRFYKSFNYDYLRESMPGPARRMAWEDFDGRWYPYVRVRLDDRITTVVGENESGKSCLLDAIQSAVTGDRIRYRDFCRHSQFFAVREGQVHYPQFGSEWTDLTEDEAERLADLCQEVPEDGIGRFWLFRSGKESADVYFSEKQATEPCTLADDRLRELNTILPHVFRLDPKLALPETVPLDYLADDKTKAHQYENQIPRSASALASVIQSNRQLFEEHAIGQNLKEVSELVRRTLTAEQKIRKSAPEELQLAHDLIRKIARIDPGVLKRLHRELIAEEDAYAGSLVEDINKELDRALNFPRFWAQDKAFQLRVSHSVNDLTFAIRDRTQKGYSFDERSAGLKYFLSYYIQYLAHEPANDGRGEILLMDEPDTYLSRQGQQDLLKIFDAFAFPKQSSRQPVQVVYVTHSPFLLDKNNVERIRVLQKGSGNEGTRVVRDVSRAHYEPLRSAFGPSLAETTFIGNCNIMVEGLADQVLLAGAARHLRATRGPGSDSLDLNSLTVVQSGGAPEMPYATFLARGRDVDRPMVLALLDSDKAGDEAKRRLLRGVRMGGRKRTPLLEQFQVIQIGDVRCWARTMEDLVPADVAVAAARRYLAEYRGWSDQQVTRVTEERLENASSAKETSMFDALAALVSSLDDHASIHKVGFARAVVEVLENDRGRDGRQAKVAGVGKLEERMADLMARLNEAVRKSTRRRTVGRVKSRVRRVRRQFLRDYPDAIAKDEALGFLEEIDAIVADDGGNLEGRVVGDRIREIRKKYFLNDTTESRSVGDSSAFREEIRDFEYAPLRQAQEGEAGDPEMKEQEA